MIFVSLSSFAFRISDGLMTMRDGTDVMLYCSFPADFHPTNESPASVKTPVIAFRPDVAGFVEIKTRMSTAK